MINRCVKEITDIVRNKKIFDLVSEKARMRNKRHSTITQIVDSFIFTVIVTVATFRESSDNDDGVFSSTTIRSRSPLNFTIVLWILLKDERVFVLFQNGRHKFPLSDGLVSGLDAVIVRAKFLQHLVRPELLENESRGCIYIYLSHIYFSFARELSSFLIRPLNFYENKFIRTFLHQTIFL